MYSKSSDRDMALKIAKEVSGHGGTVYFVGGYVRDRLRGVDNKDIDIEVHGITSRLLEEILDSLGRRISMGESFGIYSLKGCSLDIAMPRREENRGHGHRDFSVCVDPFIGTYRAALRRDFTVNALMENVLTGEITDHFGGTGDLAAGVIRHVNDTTFGEDPLRVLRAAQFAARFDFAVAEETVRLCRSVELASLSRERVMGELEKSLLKSEKPSVFFETLREMNQLSTWFPELEQTIGLEQDSEYHPEGDVWTHTMMVIDTAAEYRDKAKNPVGFMLAALVHDFGKAACTETVKGRIHSYNHEKKGLPLIKSFMNRLTAERALTHYVLNMAELHMKPNRMAADESSIKATNRMFDSSVDPEALIYLAVSDIMEKNRSIDFLMKRLEIYREYMSRPHVTGRDLIEAGIAPSENFSAYLEHAHKLRLAGVQKQQALRQTLAIGRTESPENPAKRISIRDGEDVHEKTGEKIPCTYILKCSDGTLYTGWTNDIEKRVATHNAGKGSRYTRTRTPVRPVYIEYYETKSEAMKREAEIKKLSRREKLELISNFRISKRVYNSSE